MNTTKTVYNRLFNKKTELESHKIELSSIQELKSMLSSNDSEVNNFEAFKKEIETIIRRKKVNKKQTLSSLKETKSVLDNFNKKVKELGLNAKDVKDYVNLSKSFSQLQDIVLEYDKYNL